MKKIIYCITTTLVIFIFSKCNNNPDIQKSDSSKSGNLDCSKIDNSFYNEKNNYINLDVRKIYIDSPANRFDFTGERASFIEKVKGYDPHSKPAYVSDSTEFDRKYIKSGIFVKSASFPLFIADMYSKMQTTLGIIDRSEYDTQGMETINGIRIYPAIGKDQATGKKILYMVFLGEETVTTLSGRLVVTTMIKNKYFSIRDGNFNEILPKDTLQTNADIISFQNFWHTEYPPGTPSTSPISNPNVNRSFASSIYRYYELLNGANLNIYPGLFNSALKYGIIFYPCIENNKLIFVNKGFEEVSGVKMTFETKFFYDNMDVCPDKCPSNPIQ